MTAVRLLPWTSGSGPGNMAVDAALLNSAAEQGVASLRIYGWEPATLSLGYFQRWADRASHTKSLPCPVVRRDSGGGAILHDHELTYCCTLPAMSDWASDPARGYCEFHLAWAEVLSTLGVEPNTCAANVASPSPEPFLCFQRRARGDLVVAGHKLGGSAQRRLRGALLQHGSLLLGTSPSAPELIGLADLAPVPIPTAAELRNEFLMRLAARLNWTWVPDALSNAEQELVEKLVAEKYGTDAWNQRR